MAGGTCRPRPQLLVPLLLLAAALPALSAGRRASDPADGDGRYSPLLGRLLPPGDSSARYPGAPRRLAPLRAGRRHQDSSAEDGYDLEALDDDWVRVDPRPGHPADEYDLEDPAVVWSDADRLSDDPSRLTAPELAWLGPDNDPDDWVQIGSPDDAWSLENRHDTDGWPAQTPEQWPELGHTAGTEGHQSQYLSDDGAELRRRPGPDQTRRSWPDRDAAEPEVAAGGEEARRLHAIRHALLQQPPAGRQLPRVAAVRAPGADQPLTVEKRLAAGGGGGGGGGGGRGRYMPWLLITAIAVGTVATVLGAIFVARRVRGGAGKVVTQQWIPHHVLRMATGSSDVQSAAGGGGRQGQASAEPVRIKAKGLLERRCSSSSLTIQLQQADDDGEPIVVSSPARQGEAAEYLASAGNRLSRRELRLTEDSVAALQAEFWDIPLNFADKCDIVGAGSKNRYKTVIPNEHTRVTLPGVNEDPLSSYVNANWIRGYDNEERAYIATQGPLAHTLEDFWQLVLSRRAPAIVMITKLRENGRIKCAGYLPETRQKANFGKIEVTVKRILPRNGYTLRHVTVKRGKEQLHLQHFWFTAWPDHRTPDDSQQLLQMAAEVELARRDAEGNPTGPVVVHCSAGIGRTGCFIAISIGTSQLMEEGGVDVLGIVCSMRQDRGGMVQTAEQYIFIHRALRDFEATLPPLDAPVRQTN